MFKKIKEKYKKMSLCDRGTLCVKMGVFFIVPALPSAAGLGLLFHNEHWFKYLNLFIFLPMSIVAFSFFTIGLIYSYRDLKEF